MDMSEIDIRANILIMVFKLIIEQLNIILKKIDKIELCKFKVIYFC